MTQQLHADPEGQLSGKKVINEVVRQAESGTWVSNEQEKCSFK